MKVLSRPRVVCQESSQYADPIPAAAAAAATQTPPAPSAGEPRAGSGSDGMGARSRVPCGRMVCPFSDAEGAGHCGRRCRAARPPGAPVLAVGRVRGGARWLR